MSARSSKNRSLIGLAATLIALGSPAVASANPLLSGYGGPGQGAQAIIGGGLVNTPGGGGGSGAPPTAGELTVATPAATRSSTASSKSHARHHAAARPSRNQGAGKASPVTPTGVPAVGTAAVSSEGSGGALGLSGGDVLLILFVLAGLTGTAVLTRQLTRRTP